MKPPDEERDSQPAVGAILCADWGMGAGKRTVYVADVSSRVVRRIASNIPWSVAAILSAANSMAAKGPVLAAFDAPLAYRKAIWPPPRRSRRGNPRPILRICYRAPAAYRSFS